MTSQVAASPPPAPVTFTNPRGQRLSGFLDSPAEEPLGFAVFAHCFTCSKRTRATSRVCRALTSQGLAVLRFDFAGLGDSEGDFGTETFTRSVADVVAAADWLRANHRAPALLIGHSLGGAAVIAAAHSIPEARAVATIGAPADTEHARLLFAGAADQIARLGSARISLGGAMVTIGRDLVEDLAAQPQQQRIASLRQALLVLHSPLDEVVGVDNARRIYTAARHPKSFVSLDDAGHLLDRDTDARYAARVIAAWASRYVPMAGDDEAPTGRRAKLPGAGNGPQLEPGVVEVSESGVGTYGQLVRAGRHQWRADEPESVPGARDSGPSPYDQVLGGLGSCTAMTIRMYADRKGWPLQRVTVRLRQDKVHADDCEATVDDTGPTRLAEEGGADPAATMTMDAIVREVMLVGDLDAAKRARLLEIAERCPVHRTLENGIKIITRGVD